MMEARGFIELTVLRDSAHPRIRASKVTVAVDQISTINELASSEADSGAGRTCVVLKQRLKPWAFEEDDSSSYRTLNVEESYVDAQTMLRWAKNDATKIYAQADIESAKLGALKHPIKLWPPLE
jgi:hypothetical protein